MDYIPSELRVQIFVRLPVKALVLSTCVCKSWKSFIEDPSFVEAHLQNQRSDLMLVRTRPENGVGKEAYTIYCDDENFTKYEILDFPLTYPQSGGYFKMVGNVNGVLCITTDEGFVDNDIYLWNPTIRKLVKLPFPEVLCETHGPFAHEVGFGSDAKNDFKVVRIVELHSLGSEIPLKVELYTLGTGIWRDISHLASNIKCQLIGRKPNAYVNGASHWVAETESSLNFSMIVSFHFGQEEFRCFQTPKDMHCLPSEVWPVVVQESLCLVEPNRGRYIIWMMKDYGDSYSWTKYLDVNLTLIVDRLIGFRRSGELLIQIDEKLCSFDYEKAGGKKLNLLTVYDLRIWKALQEGHTFEDGFHIREAILTFDPNAVPKDLNIRSRVEPNYMLASLYCQSYIKSLGLIGKSAVTQVANKVSEEEGSLDSISKQVETYYHIKRAMDGIPPELQEQIFVTLPIKTLVLREGERD